jgi:predicted PurR-regulated permease PerM
MNPPKQTPPWGRPLIWAAIVAAFLLIVYLLSGVLLPFVVALAVAYFIDPIVEQLEKLGIPRVGGAAIVTIAFFAIVGVTVALLVPILQVQLVGLAERLAVVARHAFDLAKPYLDDIFEKAGNVDVQQLSGAGDTVRTAASWLLGAVGGVLSGGLAVVNLLSLVFITPVVVFYLVRDWAKVQRKIDSWLPRHHADEIRGLLREMDERMAGFLRGQGLVCIFLSIFYATGLTLAGLSYGLLVGLMTGVLSFIPYVGMVVGMGTGIAIALFQFSSLVDVAIVLGVFVLGMFVEGNFVSPKLVGDRVGLHPVWMMLSIFAGGALFGFTGVLLAVPLAAAIGVLARFGLKRYLASSLYRGPEA